MHSLNAFGHGNKEFLKGSSQNEMVLLLVFFHLLYIEYNSINICFYSHLYQNQNFLLMSHFCCSCRTRASLVFLVSHLCGTRVTLVSLLLLITLVLLMSVARERNQKVFRTENVVKKKGAKIYVKWK